MVCLTISFLLRPSWGELGNKDDVAVVVVIVKLHPAGVSRNSWLPCRHFDMRTASVYWTSHMRPNTAALIPFSYLSLSVSFIALDEVAGRKCERMDSRRQLLRIAFARPLQRRANCVTRGLLEINFCFVEKSRYLI